MNSSQNFNQTQRKLFGIEMPEDVRKLNFYSLFWCAMTLILALSYVAVIQPIYLKEVIGIPPAHFGKINANLLFLNEIAAILFLGLAGALSDKYGRRILMTLGLLFGGIIFILYGYSDLIAKDIGVNSLIIVYLIRFLYAVALAFAWPQIFATITDYTYKSSRGKGMAVVGLCSAIGPLLAFTLMAAIPAKFSILTAFYVCGLICMLSALVSRFGIVDRAQHKSDEAKRPIRQLKEAMKVVRHNSALKMCYGAAFTSRADVAILGTFMIMWSVKVAETFHISSAKATMQAGLAVGIAGIVGIITAPLWGIITDRWGRIQSLALGLGLVGAGFSLLALTSDPFGMWTKICMVICGAGQFGAMIASTTLTADLSPKKVLGSVLGGFNTFGAIGIFVIGNIGGIVFDSIGYGSPFLILGSANLIVAAWALLIWKRKKDENM